MGIRGFARNLSDGRTVEVVAQGHENSIHAYTQSLKKGPPHAIVESARVERIKGASDYNGFSIM